MRGTVLALLSAVSISGQAVARDFAPADCQPSLSTEASYADANHRGWYRRFWTGACGPGLTFCFSGSNWADVVGNVARAAPPAERDALVARACRLGARVGLEWARENDVRRIDTADLRRFEAALAADPDPARALSIIEAAADRALGRR